MSIIRHLVEYRIRYLVGTLAVLLLTSTQLMHMAFNGDIKVMFDRHDPYMLRLKQLDKTYQQSQYLLIMVEPRSHSIFTRDSLQMLQALTTAAGQLPYSQRVDSITNFPDINVRGDDLSIEELVRKDVPLTREEIAHVRSVALSDDEARGKLVSVQGNAAAVVVTLALPKNHLQGVMNINKAAEALQHDFQRRYPGLTFYLNGDVAIENAILHVTMDDMLRVNPIVFFTIFVLTGLFLRSVMAIAATVSVVLVSASIAMGFLVGVGYDINPITMMAPAIIMVLAVADSIHILTQHVLYLRDGKPPVRALEESLTRNVGPVFWTSATTAIGFLGMNFGSSPPFRDMGNMAAVGVVIAFICTYTVLPAVALLIPVKNTREPLAMTGLLRHLSRWVVRGKSWVLWGFLAVVVALATQIPRLEVNDDIAHYFDDSLEIQHSIKFAHKNIQGVEYILYSLKAGGPGNINDPVFLRKVDRFANWLRSQPEVSSVESYADLVKKINRSMHDDDPAYYRIPGNRALISQYSLLYEMSLPAGMDMTRDMSRDRSSIRMVVNMRDSENKTLLAIEARTDRWLAQNMPEFRSRGTSQLLMFAHLGTSIIYSMIDGSLYTLVFITIMMIVGLRSWRYGLLSMIPNICPPVVVYGVWAMLVGQVNHAAAMTFSICLGLVVDDTIHLMSKYLHARREGVDKETAITQVLMSCGTAVMVTSFTLSFGILLLGLSHFTINDTMSLMLAGIIMVALVFDLVFLPVLLLKFDWIEEPETVKSEVEAAGEVGA